MNETEYELKNSVKMKKLLAILAIIWVAQVGYGQKDMNQLFSDFRGEDDVTSVHIGNFTMRLASLFTDTYGVKGVDVLTLDDCAEEVKERFSAAVRDLEDSDYETMLTSNEGGERTKILVKVEDELIRELVILTVGDDNAFVRIKGKISPEDLDRIIDEHNTDSI